MLDFKEIEKEARKVWKKYAKEIKKATVETDSKKPLFSFLEGPPTANAPPGLHHLEGRTYKDIVCKYKYMQGFSVPRKGGWDCHGLPVEVQIEKELKLADKKAILDYGVDKFIKKSRASVWSNIKEWNESTEELDYWVDLENPYVTLENDYVESVWWSLKELYKKKLLYEGYKVVPFCPRCGTPLSSHEVAQGYKDVKEDSVYIAFKLKKKGEYILAWTTTPWTLPGNVGLAVGKKIKYVKVKLPDGDTLILGKDRLEVLDLKYKIIEEMTGKDLVGLEYEPLYDIKELQNENSHKVIEADFVTTDDGTGIVHTAGMYGEDDYFLCKEKNIPLVHTVGQDGKFLDIVPKFKGMFVKDADIEVIKDLKERHLLLKKEKIEHSYPHCWRCESPLLYYAIDSWYIKVTAVRDKLVKLNKEINWIPSHMRDGRFGKWLEGARDWALSRFKFWGTPLPVWRCECGKDEIIGSIKELKEKAIKIPGGKLDLHKPWIDKIKIKCSCGKEMTRIPDVIDCWYDSGSASFAQFHYPFENKKEFEKRFPYDFIAEAIDQTRGWFYTMHVLGTILFNKATYKNVISMGHIVDDKGEKMSKTKGNMIKPRDIIDQAGVDAVRLQFCTADVGNQKRFSYNLMRESVIPFLNVLSNVKRYYNQTKTKKNSTQIEDKWILSKLNSLISEVTEGLEKYDLSEGYQKISNFVVNDFSRGYIKMTRDREDTKEIIGEILEKISLLLAPYAPYISEYVYQDFSKKSVHLSSWPKSDKKKIDNELELKFDQTLEIIEKGLSARDKEHIGLKWPLTKATIFSKEHQPLKELEKLILSQLNVKKIELKSKSSGEISVELDTKMTPDLEAEGYAREISRKVQGFRKDLGLVKENKISLQVITDGEFKKVLEKNVGMLKERTNSQDVNIVTTGEERFKNVLDFSIKDKRGKIGIQRVV